MSHLDPTNLNAALDWLRRMPEAKLFPAYIDAQGQHHGFVPWGAGSGNCSNDPDVIRAWHHRWEDQEVYFCIAFSQMPGHAVVDVDIKKGKDGDAALRQLEATHGNLPETLMSETPSGGYHLVFTCSEKIRHGVNKLALGVDLPGMIPVPGSQVPKKGGSGQYAIVIDAPIAALPQWAITIAQIDDRDPANDQPPVVDAGDSIAMKMALSYLRSDSCPRSIEGQGGDDTLFRVIAMVRDFGLHKHENIQVIVTEYNTIKADPPWSIEEIQTKADNVYQYANDRIGNRHPAAIFADVDDPNRPKDDGGFRVIDDMYLDNDKTDYLIKKILEKNTLNMIFGEPGTMKSFTALNMGISLCQGIPWARYKTQECTVIYVAAEGSGGMTRRVKAALKHLNYTRPAGAPELSMAISKGSYRMDTDAGTEPLLKDIKKVINDHGFGDKHLVLFIDTLAASFGGGDENSTKDMGGYVNRMKDLMKILNCTIVLIHHSGHGNKSRARGSSVLEAGLDGVYRITREEDIVCLESPKKMKDGEPAPDTFFRATQVEVGLDTDGDVMTSIALAYDPDHVRVPKKTKLTMGKAQQAFVDLLDASSEGYTAEEIREIYNDEYNKRQRLYNTQRTLEGLVEKSLLTKVDDIYYAVQYTLSNNNLFNNEEEEE